MIYFPGMILKFIIWELKYFFTHNNGALLITRISVVFMLKKVVPPFLNLRFFVVEKFP